MLPLFCVCFFLIVYVYFGYPILVVSNLLGKRKSICKSTFRPFVSILVPAHNEEATIANTLDNLLSVSYPPDRFEILVGNDGSTDQTEAVVQGFSHRKVRLVGNHLQKGKSSIENELVRQSSGSILVFTDADCRLGQDAIELAVDNFSDPTIGLVTARPSYSNEHENSVTHNEGVYWIYENWLRERESERGLLATATGHFLALRRSLWSPLDPNVGDDFVYPLQVALRGYRNVIDSKVVTLSRLAQNQPKSMLRMKQRIVSKDLRGLLANRRVLNPLLTGAVAIGLFSHKLLRWLIPYLLLLLFISTAAQSRSRPFALFLALQIVLYGLALLRALGIGSSAQSLWSAPWSFCLVNLAALLGTLHCLSGKTTGLWKPVR